MRPGQLHCMGAATASEPQVQYRGIRLITSPAQKKGGRGPAPCALPQGISAESACPSQSSILAINVFMEDAMNVGDVALL